jgi:transposase InsO family protein
MVSPSRRRDAVEHLRRFFAVSERRACRFVGQQRSTQRYVAVEKPRERAIVVRLHELAAAHPRYGYRRMTAVLRQEGWAVNSKRVYRLWRQEGLKVPQRKKRRTRLGNSENSCSRHAAGHVNHVWSYDFVMDQTVDGRRLKVMTVLDEFTRECVSLLAARSIKGGDVVLELLRLFETRGVPDCLRSDNGPEFIATAVRAFLQEEGVKPLFIEPGAPWENAYCESFNGRLRDELLDRELFTTVHEAQVVLEEWRLDYNHRRPHGALGYMPPAVYAQTALRGPSSGPADPAGGPISTPPE